MNKTRLMLSDLSHTRPVVGLLLFFTCTTSVWADGERTFQNPQLSVGIYDSAIQNEPHEALQSKRNTLPPVQWDALDACQFDIFLRDLQKGKTARIGSNSDLALGGFPVISADARYVAYSSYSINPASRDTKTKNGTQVFLYDIRAEKTSQVSVDSEGNQANKESNTPAISGEARYVAFVSEAQNLVPEDTNGISDVFLHDIQTGATTRLSVNSLGAQGNGYSDHPTISADGRYVAFVSAASNLIPGDTNNANDIFLRDIQAGTTTRVSVDSNGNQGNFNSNDPVISANGRYVMFNSNSSNLIAGEIVSKNEYGEATWGTYLHDTQTGTTIRVDVDSKDNQIRSSGSVIPANGPYMAFVSPTSHDILLRDTQTATTLQVDVSPKGNQARNEFDYPAISKDGRYLVFESKASNLVRGDTNNAPDIFLRDLKMHTTTRVSLDSTGKQRNGPSIYLALSANGQYVVFISYTYDKDECFHRD